MSPETQKQILLIIAGCLLLIQSIIFYLDKKAKDREIKLMREEIEKLEHELWLKKQELHFMRHVPHVVEKTAEDESRNQSLKILREMYQ